MVVKPKPKAKPRPAAVAPKPKSKPKPVAVKRTPQPRPAVKPIATHTVKPVAVVPAASFGTEPGNSSNDLARTLLLALALLFLVLAAIPWRLVFHYSLVPEQVARLRVAFAAISVSVAFGYVIAVYLNGSV